VASVKKLLNPDEIRMTKKYFVTNALAFI